MEPCAFPVPSWPRGASSSLYQLHWSVGTKDVIISGFVHFSVGIVHLILNAYLVSGEFHHKLVASGNPKNSTQDYKPMLTPTFLPGFYFILTSFTSCLILTKKKRLMAILYSLACFLSGALSVISLVKGLTTVLNASYKNLERPLDDILIVIVSLLEISASFFGLALASLFAMQDALTGTETIASRLSSSGVHPRQRLVSIEISGSIVDTSHSTDGDSTYMMAATTSTARSDQSLMASGNTGVHPPDRIDTHLRISRYRRRRLQRRGISTTPVVQNPHLLSQAHLPPPTYQGESSTNEPPPPYDQIIQDGTNFL